MVNQEEPGPQLPLRHAYVLARATRVIVLLVLLMSGLGLVPALTLDHLLRR